MFHNILKDLKLDAMIITDPYNMRYISGFRGGEGILYLSGTQTILVTDSRYTEQAAKESNFTVVEECSTHKRADILRESIEKEKKTDGFRMG